MRTEVPLAIVRGPVSTVQAFALVEADRRAVRAGSPDSTSGLALLHRNHDHLCMVMLAL
jgi:hypothetical protein